jgi:serralysin
MSLKTPPSAYAQGFHTKSFLWKGIYVLGNNQVPDEAVLRAAEFVFNSMGRVSSDIIQTLAQYDTRFAVIPFGTEITDLPDYADLGSSWSHFRGLGAVVGRPTSSAGEENILPDHPDDPYFHSESIGLHEWLHAIEGIGLRLAKPGLHADFMDAYDNALSEGLWNLTYASATFFEYFAETAQAYFNNNPDRGEPGDGIHNSINTRAELQAYDPTVYALHRQLFGNTSWTVGEFYGSQDGDDLIGRGDSELIFGNGGHDFIAGNGGGDYLLGGSGNDVVIGGSGKDQMDGGGGNDTADYADSTKRVDLTLKGSSNATVKVDGKAEDTIRNFENALGGSGNDKLTGSSKANYLDGSDGRDTLNGAGGNDTLVGGPGADRFLFNTALSASKNVDVIVGFKAGTDKILLENAIFTGIGSKLDNREFYSAPGATGANDNNDRIVYDPDSGKLYLTAEGKLGDITMHFATLENRPAGLGASDFLIV